MTSSLKLDERKSALVTRHTLAQLPEPRPLGPKHAPIHHMDLVAALDAEIARRGYREVRSAFALSKKGAAIFGVIDLESRDTTFPDRVPSLGFRSSNDQSLALRMVAGTRVVVCDNLALMGDMIALHRLHTSGLKLVEAMTTGFDRFLHHSTILDEHIARMSATVLTDGEARALAFRIFADRVLPVAFLEPVNRFYFTPLADEVDCHGRNLWALHNAFTRALRALSPTRLFNATMTLASYFGMTSQPNLFDNLVHNGLVEE